jgi:exopolysaccharide biosynthesis polyprenyl glycosylphosphotransferase
MFQTEPHVKLRASARPRPLLARDFVPPAPPPAPTWLAPVSMLGIDALAAAVLLAVAGVSASSPAGAITASLCLLVGALVSRRVADVRLMASTGLLEELPRILVLAVSATFAGAVVAPLSGDAAWATGRLLGVASLLGLAALAGQILTIRIVRSLVPPERLLLIGDRADRARFLRQLEASDIKHLRPVAGTDVDRLGRGNDDLPTLELLIDRMVIDRVVVLPGDDPNRDAQVARRARNAGARVMVVPSTMAAIGERVRTERIGAAVAVSADPSSLPLSARILKRGLDLTGAAAGLLLLAPVMAVIALAVRFTSHGPVLFWQDRVGLDGRRFRIAKFRTMVAEAEALKDSLRHRNEAGGGLFKMADDPRITRVGKLLRRTSLDELPQLLNVLRGDMSLVGPRPLVGDEDVLIEGWYRDRLKLKPGMTGAWQIMGSARIPLDEMVALDHQYVASWSLWLDVRILLRTTAFVIGRRGL